jgi:peptidoglycan/xylan/chitin deacetylase (PgdA/CDA1 family)
MKIENDTLHSLFIKVVSFMFLRYRVILNGHWGGVKSICISFDCDYQEDMEASKCLIEFLHMAGIDASFAIPGRLAIAFPDLVEELIKNGHEILNHTFSHPPNFRSLTYNDMKVEVEKFQKFMKQNHNYVPKGFRSPHGLRKPSASLFQILKENGMYDSSFVGYGVANINNVWEIPLTPCPEHPLMAFDSYHHFRLPVFTSSEKKVLLLWELLLKKNDFINIFLDPIDLTTEARLRLLKEMIKRARDFNFLFIQMGRLYEELKSYV